MSINNNTKWFFVSQQFKESEGSALAEMQREVEDLRLRLQMAAEHYKDKYKECQKLQKQVSKLNEQQGVSELQFVNMTLLSIGLSVDSLVPFDSNPFCVSGEKKSRFRISNRSFVCQSRGICTR